ncbi:MAG: glycerophosphoryl diester phosphodiesterase [Alphaproteobacteria bacterium]|nr:glycerophosphoryl diester phosphodiesterase [Alphaproteobacteria bacterium]
MLKLPKIIGHRGAAAYAPENTLDGIRTAADMGLQWVELDVKLSKDGVAIIFHDDELDRTTNGTGKVAETDFATLQDLDCGSWFSDSFIGTEIPTLEQALEEIINLNMCLNLEIKPCPGRELETAEVALDILARYWDEPQKLLLSSFEAVSLETCKDMAPEWLRGYLLEKEPHENWQEYADYLDITTLNINGAELTIERLNEYRQLNKPLLAYTINDAQMAHHLFHMGISGIFTDAPDLLLSD